MNEEGTGLGPSLEFYALLALEVQRNDLHMWVAADVIKEFEEQGDQVTVSYLSPIQKGIHCKKSFK